MGRRNQAPRTSPTAENVNRLIQDLPKAIRRRQIAFEAIEEAKRILDPSYWLFHSAVPEQQELQTCLAREFLLEIEKRARRKGGKRGYTPTTGENQRIIRVLTALNTGCTITQIAKAETDDDPGTEHTPQERSRVLRLRRPEWCKRIYDAMIQYYGEHRRSAIATATNGMIQHVFK